MDQSWSTPSAEMSRSCSCLPPHAAKFTCLDFGDSVDLTNDERQEASSQALLAGTFASITTWADPHLTEETALNRQRDLIARKIVSNLYYLKTHPEISEELRMVLGRSHDRWLSIARRECPCEASDTTLSWPHLPESNLVH